MEHRWHRSMRTVPQSQWNQLDTISPTPLLSWDWLNHLETSGSITPASGWTPNHLTLWDRGKLVGAVSLYLRDNSWGEFVFDFAFAELADRLGKEYYPKLVGMSPASPTPAFRFLTVPGREDEITPILFDAIRERCESDSIPVLQFNFVLPTWVDRFRRYGMQRWEHHGFEWRNEDFSSFDDYLSRFRKNQRKNVRKERRSMEEQGISLRVVDASGAPEHVFRRMAEYYRNTNDQFGPYAARFLRDSFFTAMPEEVRRDVWFVVAEDRHDSEEHDIGDPVALAMLLRRGERILGRYWGTREFRKDLHFNACYYAPIEWAIAEGVRVFDPGMGSPHKVRRGFRSVPNWSLHYFFDRDMQHILEANIGRINRYEHAHIQLSDEAVPYKK